MRQAIQGGPGGVRILQTVPVEGTAAEMAADAAAIILAGTEVANQGKRWENTTDGLVYDFRPVSGTWGYYPETNADASGSVPVVIEDAPVQAQNQSIDGNATVAASATDNVEIYKSGDLTGYSYHAFENNATADPIDIYGSIDGTNFAATPLAVVLHDDLTAGNGAVIDIPAGDIGIIRGKWKAIKVLRKGTTNETQDINYFHGVL